MATLLYACQPSELQTDPEFPLGTVVYVMPDSTKAVACGGWLNQARVKDFLWVQYTSKMGNIEKIAVNKKLLYK